MISCYINIRIKREYWRYSAVWERIVMKKCHFNVSFKSKLLGICSGLLILGCSESKTLNIGSPAQIEPGKETHRSFAQFPDIPIPSEVEMDINKTLILGSGDHWLGRLVLNSGRNANEVFNFYKRKMPTFGWQEITSVRSAISVLAFSKKDRVSTIQIQSRTLQGSKIHLTMSPRDRKQDQPKIDVLPGGIR